MLGLFRFLLFTFWLSCLRISLESHCLSLRILSVVARGDKCSKSGKAISTGEVKRLAALAEE